MTTHDAVAHHCAELNRCNQRGGRMLSMLDLLEAKTLDLDLAAFLMAHVSHGASFMVGARPGGAGKTTVMCALLNLIPLDCEIVAATASAVRAASAGNSKDRKCYACHEIGSGPYFAYLWGADLRAYCALTEKGHILATNLHADDLDEAQDQVCRQNRAPAEHFNAFNLLVFLRVSGGYGRAGRRIEKVYVSDGTAPHVLAFEAGRGLVQGATTDDEYARQGREFLEECLKANVRTIEDTRAAVVGFLAGLS